LEDKTVDIIQPGPIEKNNTCSVADTNIRDGASLDKTNILVTAIACFGLFENSSAVVIGAMVVAMLLGPIIGKPWVW
jgi:hypothetical protein